MLEEAYCPSVKGGQGYLWRNDVPLLEENELICLQMGKNLQAAVGENSKLKTCVQFLITKRIQMNVCTHICICIENSMAGHKETGDSLVSVREIQQNVL